MICKKIKLQNYRNISSATVEFSPGVNVIYGENAQGKTNLLEAVYTFARGKSFRRTAEKDILKKGEEFYEIALDYEDKKREQSLRILYSDKTFKRFHNEIKLMRSADMISRFRAVIFSPENLEMIKGGPSERRDFLNIAISQLSQEYVSLLSSYNVALENRNALLRILGEKITEAEKRDHMLTLEVWNGELSKYAARISAKRYEYIEKIAPYIEFYASEMSGGRERLQIKYQTEAPHPYDIEDTEMFYKKLYLESAEKDIIFASTSRGVHRDDIDIKIDGMSARYLASQGQQRTAVLAFKLAEGELSREKSGEYPVFLFDDVLSELDSGRQQYLIKKAEGKQFIVTTCEKDAIFPDAKMIRTEGGCFYI